MTGAVTQYVADLQTGDAVGDIVRAIDRLLKRWGVTATMAAAGWGTELRGEVMPYQQAGAVSGEHLHIYHFSVACSPLTAHFKAQRGAKMLIYHNITPPQWFKGYDEGALWATGLARSELAGLKGHVDVAASYSAYNCQELRDLGFERVEQIPFVLDFSRFKVTADAALLAKLRDGGSDRHNVLFVGRLAPNKCQEDVVRAFFRYGRSIEPRSHLYLVGPHSIPTYVDRVRELIHGLGLDERVTLSGRVTDAELAAYYEGADAFLCMSEHEGFCVPLLEAMHYGVPVLAYAAAAVPDTMGPAGVLVRDKKFDEIAEMLHLLITDAALRQQIIEGQREQLKRFDENAADEGLRRALEAVTRPAGV
jgi:glycosyltransferase involved in cell wall biosynthesis